MTPRTRTALLLLGLLGVVQAGPASAETKRDLWKWTDADGVVHFSDKPQPGATRVSIATGVSTPAAQPVVPTQPANSKPPVQERVQYESLQLTQPGNGETFFNTDAQVPVGLALTPSLARGDELALYLDGQRVEGFPPTALDYLLTDLERGAHTLTAAVVDRDGNILLRSDARVFHIRQNSVANPPVGPGVRPPPPRPTPRN
jgi:hypothetical protein